MSCHLLLLMLLEFFNGALEEILDIFFDLPLLLLRNRSRVVHAVVLIIRCNELLVDILAKLFEIFLWESMVEFVHDIFHVRKELDIH